MKNNKKGFTLIELLAVIVLLGVILTIAVLSISSISKAVKSKQKENLISRIKIAAKRYVTDTEVKKVYVETLIYEGLIEADDESQMVYDPETKESLNCYYVDYTNENNPQFIAGDCNPEIVNDSSVAIKYCIATSGRCTPNMSVPNDWLNSDQIYLGASSSTMNLNDSTVSYSWISPLAPDVYNSNKIYHVEIPETQYINDVYEVIISKDGKTYKGSTRLKVDTKIPIVKDILVNNPDDFKQNKTITATLQDNESGLKAYIITQSNTVPASEWTNISGTEEKVSKTINKNGIWYVWVMDKAGNTNATTIETNSIKVHKIDATAPTCTSGGDNSNWTKNDVTIWWGCDDGNGENDSGCDVNYSGSSKVYNKTTKTDNIPVYTIKDNAGNETVCKDSTGKKYRSADVYVDKTKPTVSAFTITSSESEYNSKKVNISITASDSDSEVDKICFTTTNSSDGCSWQSPTNNNYTTSYTLNSNDGSGDSITLYAFSKDKAGNISSSKSSTYKIYTACTNKTISGYESSYGECSVSCGGGYKYRDIYYKDTYLGTSCPTSVDGDFTTCNTQPCCSEGTYTNLICTSDGYWQQRRYNECLGKYEYRTTSSACISPYYGCTWGSCQSDGYRYQTCNYKYGGSTYTDTVDSEPCLDSINDYRYNGCDEYYITTCDATDCSYSEKNGVSSSGTIPRNSLTTSMPDSCYEPEEDDTVNSCAAYISSKDGSIVKFTLSSECEVESYITTGRCSGKGSKSNWIKVGFDDSVHYSLECLIEMSISGTYTWNDNVYRSIRWTTYQCGQFTEKGLGFYCTGSSASEACKNSSSTCV